MPYDYPKEHEVYYADVPDSTGYVVAVAPGVKGDEIYLIIRNGNTEKEAGISVSYDLIERLARAVAIYRAGGPESGNA